MDQIIRELFPEAKKTGGEYHGPCFKCGGVDRFVVWPAQGNQGLFRVWCRQCNYMNDALGYVIDAEGLEWREAHHRLGIPVPDGTLEPEDLAARALEAQIHARRAAGLMAYTEADRTAEIALTYVHATNEGLIGDMITAFGEQDRARFRAALAEMGGRLWFLTAFLAHQYGIRPVATEKLIASIQGIDSSRGAFDGLGMDKTTLDNIDRLGWPIIQRDDDDQDPG